MRRLARATLVPGLLLAGGTLLAACGIPLSNAAQPVPRSRVPAGLLDAPTSTSTTLPASSTNAMPIGIYFLDSAGTKLVETFARVQPPPTAIEALDFLTYGPTASDSKHGLRTALSLSPQATPRVKVNRQTGIAIVTLDAATYDLPGAQEFQALAQIVYTVTDAQFGAHAVQFAYAGEPALAYLPNGTYTPRPVTRADYATLAPVKTAERSNDASATATTSAAASIHTARRTP